MSVAHAKEAYQEGEFGEILLSRQISEVVMHFHKLLSTN
jgi:hypothetical protein